MGLSCFDIKLLPPPAFAHSAAKGCNDVRLSKFLYIVNNKDSFPGDYKSTRFKAKSSQSF